jgi:hypothetical protein
MPNFVFLPKIAHVLIIRTTERRRSNWRLGKGQVDKRSATVMPIVIKFKAIVRKSPEAAPHN